MTYLAIAVRPIDLAIFATLGLLWIGGALFIVALYRWIRRYEREQDPNGPGLIPAEIAVQPAKQATPRIVRQSGPLPHPAR